MINTKKQINKLSEIEKAYIAGFFDADGCIAVSRIASRSSVYPYDYRIVFIIVNTDTKVISWLKDTVGAGCSYVLGKQKRENWNICHRYQITGERARILLDAIRPYLIIKKERVDVALSMPNTMQKGRSGKSGRTEQEYVLQEAVFEKLKRLNKRGIKSLEI